VDGRTDGWGWGLQSVLRVRRRLLDIEEGPAVDRASGAGRDGRRPHRQREGILREEASRETNHCTRHDISLITSRVSDVGVWRGRKRNGGAP
jgi:hypothetical protein